MYVWRRGRDLNPRVRCGHRLSRPAPWAARAPRHGFFLLLPLGLVLAWLVVISVVFFPGVFPCWLGVVCRGLALRVSWIL